MSVGPRPPYSLSLGQRIFQLDAFCIFGRLLYTMIELYLLCSRNSSIPINLSNWIKGGGWNPRDHIGGLQREECWQEESAIKHKAICFPKSLTRYYALLFNSLKRGKTFFAFQCRSLNHEALLHKQTEKSPEKLFIQQAHCTKGKLLINQPSLSPEDAHLS